MHVMQNDSVLSASYGGGAAPWLQESKELAIDAGTVYYSLLIAHPMHCTHDRRRYSTTVYTLHYRSTLTIDASIVL
jgi:hypothetical protein